MRSNGKVFLVASLLAMLVAGCAGGQTDQQTRAQVRLPMGFVPNVQYAPFYVADARGYFDEAGIDITFDYSAETDGIALVGSGELPFTLASGEQVLLARQQGAPVVYVFAWWQDFPVAVAAPTELGLKSPADLAGLAVGLPGRFGASYIGLRALLSVAGLTEDDLQLESIGFNQVEALATGQVEAVVVYANNEPIQLRAQGFDIDVLRVSDHVELASNGLVTNETTIAENPDLVRAMVAAIDRGLQDTLADPEAAYTISQDYVEGLAEADRQIQMEVLLTSIAFWQAERLGEANAQAWVNMQQLLLTMEMLTEEQPLGDAYTNQFLPELQ
jgi:NitT/TauT family transport system substrate-binding protein